MLTIVLDVKGLGLKGYEEALHVGILAFLCCENEALDPVL
jgi:hypothetical protein